MGELYSLILITCIVTCVILVAGAEGANVIFVNSIFNKLGDWSYSIYLWHLPVIVFYTMLHTTIVGKTVHSCNRGDFGTERGIGCYINKSTSFFDKRTYYDTPKIELFIAPQHVKTIEKELEKANVTGFPPDIEWLPARIVLNNSTMYKAQVTLKGSWPDHWGDNYSIKVKITDKKNTHLLGMKRFSLIIAHRSSLAPLAHEFKKENNLIYFRYYPVSVFINGKKKSNYRLEESLNKEILENSHRTESIMLSLDARRIFVQGSFSGKQYGRLPVKVSYPSNKKTNHSIKLQKNRELAYSMLLGYKLGFLGYDNFWDTRKNIQEIALSNAINDSHSFIPFNVKYYFNPTTRKIEPIVFDYDSDNLQYANVVYSDYACYKNDGKNMLFTKFYKQIASWATQNKLNTYAPHTDYSKFQKSLLKVPQYNNCNAKTRYLKASNIIDGTLFVRPINLYYFPNSNNSEIWIENVTNSTIYIDNIYNGSPRNSLFSNLEIKPHTSANGIIKLKVNKNIDYNNLKAIVHYYQKESSIAIKPEISDEELSKRKALWSKELKEIYENSSNKVQVTVSADIIYGKPYSNKDIKFQPLSVKETLNKFNFLRLTNKTFTVKKGTWNINQDLIIPKGYSLNIENSTLKFSKGARLVLREAPIQIINSTLTSQNENKGWLGLVILQANYKEENNRSMVKDSIIENIKYINGDMYAEPWMLTGAITFYEADVDVINSTLKSNNTEDLLHIQSSNFTIDSSKLLDVPSDAFDSDFSKGKIINSTFDNILGDAIDISGSNITAENSIITNVVDKAMSIGEKSNFKANNMTVKNSGAGIVSKDGSQAVISNSLFTDIDTAVYMSFVKKGEYAHIATSLTASNNQEDGYNSLYEVEENTNLVIDGKAKRHTNFNDEALYKEGLFKKIQW